MTRPDRGYSVRIGEVNKRIFREFTTAGIEFAYSALRQLLEQLAQDDVSLG